MVKVTDFNFNDFSKETSSTKNKSFNCCDSVCIGISNKNEKNIFKIHLDDVKLNQAKYGKSCDFILIDLKDDKYFYIEIKTSGSGGISDAAEQIGNTIDFINHKNDFIKNANIKIKNRKAFAYSRGGWGNPKASKTVTNVLKDFAKDYKTTLTLIQKNEKIKIE
jgi:hypothetical protein